VRHLPALSEDLEAAEPEWHDYPGWQTKISELRTYDALPAAAKAYVSTLESFLAAPIRFVGVGPAREQLIDRFEPHSSATNATALIS
jgi:adenylosuccinate synthase